MFNDFYKAFNYLHKHPLFQERFHECLDIEVVKVNPKTKSIDDDSSKNTETAVWLECGQYSKYSAYHDINLDCGGRTFEEAIIKLANLVQKHYGDNYQWVEAGPPEFM